MDDEVRALLSPEGEAEYLRQREIDDIDLAELRRRRLELYPEPVKAKPQPKAQPGMTDDDRQWVQHQLDLCTRSISKCVTEDDEKVLAHVRTLKAEIVHLKEQVAALKCGIEDLSKHKATKSDVVPLMRARDVA